MTKHENNAVEGEDLAHVPDVQEEYTPTEEEATRMQGLLDSDGTDEEAARMQGLLDEVDALEPPLGWSVSELTKVRNAPVYSTAGELVDMERPADVADDWVVDIDTGQFWPPVQEEPPILAAHTWVELETKIDWIWKRERSALNNRSVHFLNAIRLRIHEMAKIEKTEALL